MLLDARNYLLLKHVTNCTDSLGTSPFNDDVKYSLLKKLIYHYNNSDICKRTMFGNSINFRDYGDEFTLCPDCLKLLEYINSHLIFCTDNNCNIICNNFCHRKKLMAQLYKKLGNEHNLFHPQNKFFIYLHCMQISCIKLQKEVLSIKSIIFCPSTMMHVVMIFIVFPEHVQVY